MLGGEGGAPARPGDERTMSFGTVTITEGSGAEQKARPGLGAAAAGCMGAWSAIACCRRCMQCSGCAAHARHTPCSPPPPPPTIAPHPPTHLTPPQLCRSTTWRS